MPYDLIIKTSSDTIQKQVKDLEEFKEVLKDYEKCYVEVELKKVKEKKLTK